MGKKSVLAGVLLTVGLALGGSGVSARGEDAPAQTDEQVCIILSHDAGNSELPGCNNGCGNGSCNVSCKPK